MPDETTHEEAQSGRERVAAALAAQAETGEELNADEALGLASEELHAMRRESR